MVPLHRRVTVVQRWQKAAIHTCRENVELLSGNMVERGHVGLEVLGEDLLGHVGHPVG